MIVNNELDRMWKELAMAYYKRITQPGGTKQSCKNPQSR
jgi:hypothetical protein